MPFWSPPGARENITQGSRIAELKANLLVALAWFLACAGILAAIVGIAWLIDPDFEFVVYMLTHVRHFIAFAVWPIVPVLCALAYVCARDLFDPHFQPLSKPIARTRPLWPWREWWLDFRSFLLPDLFVERYDDDDS